MQPACERTMLRSQGHLAQKPNQTSVSEWTDLPEHEAWRSLESGLATWGSSFWKNQLFLDRRICRYENLKKQWLSIRNTSISSDYSHFHKEFTLCVITYMLMLLERTNVLPNWRGFLDRRDHVAILKAESLNILDFFQHLVLLISCVNTSAVISSLENEWYYKMLAVSIFFFAKKTTSPRKQSNTDGSPPLLSHFSTYSSQVSLRNTFAVDTSAARWVNRVQNGSLYTIGSGDDQMWFIHVWGTLGYDYGFACGIVLKERIEQFLPRAWAYFQGAIASELKNVTLP